MDTPLIVGYVIIYLPCYQCPQHFNNMGSSYSLIPQRLAFSVRYIGLR